MDAQKGGDGTSSRLRGRLLNWAFELLYTRLAWAYDGVSWLVSRGEWNAWGRAVLPYVHGPRVLEVAFGPGHLLPRLAGSGHDVIGIDRSPWMVHLARRRLRATGASYPLVLADVTRLPVKSASINTVVMTFPATFMRSALTYREVRRVLPPGGRWVLADNGRLLGRDPWSRLCNFAFRVAASAPGTGSGHFAAAGFTTMTHSVRFRRSLVEVVVATA